MSQHRQPRRGRVPIIHSGDQGQGGILMWGLRSQGNSGVPGAGAAVCSPLHGLSGLRERVQARCAAVAAIAEDSLAQCYFRGG